jgi:hypothetical protein
MCGGTDLAWWVGQWAGLGGPRHLPHVRECHGSRATQQPTHGRTGKLRLLGCGLEKTGTSVSRAYYPQSRLTHVLRGGMLCRQNIGECTAHARHCGAGQGIFLLVNKGSIVLMRDSRAAFYPVGTTLKAAWIPIRWVYVRWGRSHAFSSSGVGFTGSETVWCCVPRALQSVYVDQYGEEDPHLRRGRPLFLSRQR